MGFFTPTHALPHQGGGEKKVLPSTEGGDWEKWICRRLNADGQFDEKRCSLGFIVPDSDISVVICDDGIDNGQP